MTNTHYSRRHFIKTVSIGTGALALGSLLSGCSKANFLHGVASGDPLADRVVIWTRATPERDAKTVEVAWVVATDSQCKNIVGSGVENTDAARDYTVKLDVSGLSPGRTYYYQFLSDDNRSPIGRTKTLPKGEVDTFSLAVMSCSNYPAGYFHVYAEVAARDELNAVLHLGDYIYEYPKDGYATEDAEALGRVPVPATELITLADYRQRYAQYRSDPDLQKAHGNHPFICVWDDHEIANNAWRKGAQNHNENEGDWPERKAYAVQAYYEWLPVREPTDNFRERLYRHFKVGNLLDLYMLDARLIGRDEQLSFKDYLDKDTGKFSAERFRTDLSNPKRTLLGEQQRHWLLQHMTNSAATWQVLGQQVLAGSMTLPAPIATRQMTMSEYSALAKQAKANPKSLTPEQAAALKAPAMAYNLDAWDGYPAEREMLFSTARQLDKNLVVLAGDTHNAWANNLTTMDGTPVGVEFATASVSSPGLESYFPEEDPQKIAAGLVKMIPGLQYANLQYRGYLTVQFTTARCLAQWRFIDTVKTKTYQVLDQHSKDIVTYPGAVNRKLSLPGA